MCGRRRQGGCAGRSPLVVVLGKMAYDKYQERKERRVANDGQPLGLPEPHDRSSIAQYGTLEKAPTNPPSYDDVIVNRAIEPERNLYLDEKKLDWNAAKDFADDIGHSSDEEQTYDVADGMRHSTTPPSAQTLQKGCHQNKCQQRRAAKAARKAEKWAAKAAAMEMRM